MGLGFIVYGHLSKSKVTEVGNVATEITAEAMLLTTTDSQRLCLTGILGYRQWEELLGMA